MQGGVQSHRRGGLLNPRARRQRGDHARRSGAAPPVHFGSRPDSPPRQGIVEVPALAPFPLRSFPSSADGGGRSPPSTCSRRIPSGSTLSRGPAAPVMAFLFDTPVDVTSASSTMPGAYVGVSDRRAQGRVLPTGCASRAGRSCAAMRQAHRALYERHFFPDAAAGAPRVGGGLPGSISRPSVRRYRL
jgi:hypothetical protein